MKVVIDADVVLSGLRSPAGASRTVLLAGRKGVITLLASVAIMLEYEAVLKRSENLAAMGAFPSEIDTFLDGLALLAEPVAPGFSHRPSIRDPDDEMFVEAAINGHADALVTFNRNDCLPADHRAVRLGIDICRPGELQRRLTWRPSATTRSGFRLQRSRRRGNGLKTTPRRSNNSSRRP
ncbi:MAG TPA: putative toxin-antitoxin system toxin component, PIN family [Acetobacteraceae bacterium]|nr:putative toxin-antitoxin system toxin component, PIN family [Acetobacteraceae bacterium]